ncbi:MAG: phenylpyruvate tautomerase MIF-related protein [Gammaproteobacteria bacterium]
MPFLTVQTNIILDPNARAELLAALSRTVAENLGKSEQYVMVSVEDAKSMLFAGEDSPLAYMELKSIELPGDRTKALSHSLCTQLNESIGIPGDRIYIEFADAPRHLWGWNKSTF